MKNNYAVILLEGDYPDGKGSMCTLIGIYPTKKAAKFISQIVRDRYKLKFYPKIVETQNSPTSKTVEDYLKRQADEQKTA